MGKQRRRKVTVRYIYEGELTEFVFMEYLKSLYPSSIAVADESFCGRGGTADSQVTNVLKRLFFSRIYLILDEDFYSKGPISDENLRNLENEWGQPLNSLNGISYSSFLNMNVSRRNPIIVFSNPSSIEGIILQILGKEKTSLMGKSTKMLKNMLQSYIGEYFRVQKKDRPKDNGIALFQFFQSVLSLEKLQTARKSIPELDVILGIFE